jgi:hypothetical protein
MTPEVTKIVLNKIKYFTFGSKLDQYYNMVQVVFRSRDRASVSFQQLHIKKVSWDACLMTPRKYW